MGYGIKPQPILFFSLARPQRYPTLMRDGLTGSFIL